MWFSLSLLLCAAYAGAKIQVVLDIEQQQAFANCKALATDGETVSAMSDGKGGWNCGGCEGEVFVDGDGHFKCCLGNTKHSTDHIHPANGKCCPTGTSYTFDAITGKGDCCPPGQTFMGTACTAATHPTPLNWPALKIEGGCSGCGNGNVCSANGHLGIQYGHCYTMTDSNGKQIQRDEGFRYKQQDVSNDKTIGLVFRICNSTTDCTQKLDQYVPENGYWFQLDQNGWRDGTSPGWMIFLDTYLLSMSTTWITQGYSFANFTGQGSCFLGECAISLQFGVSDTLKLYGLASYSGGYLSRCSNPNSWRPYYYEEVRCKQEINAW